jgi:CubicO group peptidase (beta-lactamase class C family)
VSTPDVAIERLARTLVPLPAQPAGTPWPTESWPVGDPVPEIKPLLDAMHADEERYGTTYATVVVVRGELVHERYGGAIPHFDRPPTPVEPDMPLLSWSMAKSILHCAIGVLVGEGRVTLDAPAPVAAWANDGRAAITLEQLLCMRDGLAYNEDYVDAGVSDVIEMLFGAGIPDVAGYAIARPLAHEPGTVFNYSSGTSNIVARILGDVVGSGDATRAFLRRAVFDPIGMRTAEPRLDDAGTFVGSSYVYATATDFARFGLLYLRDGVWDGTRVIPEGWVDHGRRARSRDLSDGRIYGAHWWVVDDDLGTFWASGYEGQSVLVTPGLDTIVVRLGRSQLDAQTDALTDWRAEMVTALRSAVSF